MTARRQHRPPLENRSYPHQRPRNRHSTRCPDAVGRSNHDTRLNPHGAVAVLGVGGWLGVKPDEMEWLDEMPSCQPEPDIHG